MNCPIHRHIPQNIMTDALLGMPLEFADLSIYKVGQEPDVVPTDFQYAPDLGEARTQLVLPGPVTPARVHHEVRPQEKPKPVVVKSTYLQSGFVRRRDDEGVQEQLRNAFDGDVPEGDVVVIRRGIALEVMVAQEPLDTRKALLMSRGREFLKVVEETSIGEDGEENIPRPSRAYTVSSEESKATSVYFFYDDEGCKMGEIKKYKLRPLTSRQMNTEEMTATPVKILRDDDDDPVEKGDDDE